LGAVQIIIPHSLLQREAQRERGKMREIIMRDNIMMIMTMMIMGVMIYMKHK